ncbi:MAG: SEC-C metal-binding domain-containing protein, partial [Sedimenticola sp.]
MKNKIGRNDSCFCGSGKKYKKCCFNQGENSYTSNNAPPIKISEAILKILEPLLKRHPKRKHIIVLIDLTILAWNISLSSGKDREDMEDKIIDLLPKEFDAVSLATTVKQIDLLVERKKKLYPEIRHVIVNHNLSFGENGQLTLDVNSIPIDNT